MSYIERGGEKKERKKNASRNLDSFFLQTERHCSNKGSVNLTFHAFTLASASFLICEIGPCFPGA